MVDLKISFSKYDYFGIIIPGIIVVVSIILSLPMQFYLDLGILLKTIGELEYFFIFLIGISFVILSYFIGMIISALGSWLIENIVIKKFLNYQTYHLFKSKIKINSVNDKVVNKTKKILEKKNEKKEGFFFKKYKEPYSKEFQQQFEVYFGKYFNKIRYSDEDKFKLCFAVVKENCPITYGRLSTFISLYNLSRNLTISFSITIPILIYNYIIFQNFLFLIGILVALMFIFFFFKNYLKYFKIYADEVFRAFYIFCLEKEKLDN